MAIMQRKSTKKLGYGLKPQQAGMLPDFMRSLKMNNKKRFILLWNIAQRGILQNGIQNRNNLSITGQLWNWPTCFIRQQGD